MFLSKEVMKELKQRKSPEVILEFISNPAFKEEFLEFVEEVLNWSGPEKEKSKNENSEFSNN